MGNQHRKRNKGEIARIIGEGVPFTPLRLDVITSPEWQRLSKTAQSLYIDLLAQLKPPRKGRGGNNGNLTLAFSTMHSKGFGSKSTLQKAKTELLKAGFLLQAWENCRHGKATVLYALSTHTIDYIDNGRGQCLHKLDYKTGRPPDTWKQQTPLKPAAE